MDEDNQIAGILDDETHLDEPDSQLWHDLYVWAFAQDPQIPPSDEITEVEARRLLDDAARRVSGLETPAQWMSAARYFQAENFHGLSRPACTHALALLGQRSGSGS